MNKTFCDICKKEIIHPLHKEEVKIAITCFKDKFAGVDCYLDICNNCRKFFDIKNLISSIRLYNGME